jgi:hypothetical protein
MFTSSKAKEESKKETKEEAELKQIEIQLDELRKKESALKKSRENREAKKSKKHRNELKELQKNAVKSRGFSSSLFKFGRPSLGARKLSRNRLEPRINQYNPLVEERATLASEVLPTNNALLLGQALGQPALNQLSEDEQLNAGHARQFAENVNRPRTNRNERRVQSQQLASRHTRRNNQLGLRQNIGQVQETIQGIPVAVGEIQNTVRINRDQLEELLSLVRPMAQSVHNIESHSEAHSIAIDDVKSKVIERSKKLEYLYKKMRHGRSGLNIGTNLIIYYICLYYKMLWTLTRFCLEYIYLMTRLGMEFCNMAPLWTLGIGQCLLIYLLWILYCFVIQGAVFFVLPIPNYSIYPLVFNEGYLLDFMAVQLGGLVLTLFNGLNRIRNITNPANRALGLFAESAGLYNAKDYVWGLIEGPYNYVTDEVVGRLTSRLSGLMPDSVSSLGSSVVSGVSTLSSSVASGASTIGSSVASSASTIGSSVASGASSLASGASSLVSGAGAAKNYLKSYWTGSGGSNSPKLIVNQEYDLTEKSFNLVDFEEFDKISLLTPEQQKEFNKSTMGKNLNRLKTIMDNVFIKNIEHILKFETLRVSEFMIYIGNILDNIVDNGMPYFRQSFSDHVEVYKELKKHKLKVINTKQFFPELLSIDIETFLDPRRNFRMKKTLKRK